MFFVSTSIPKRIAELKAAEAAVAAAAERKTDEESRQSVKEQLKTAEVEICLGKQLSTSLLASHGELAHRVARMRRAFAKQYGFVVPEIKITDDITIPTKAYQIKNSRDDRGLGRAANRRYARYHW